MFNRSWYKNTWLGKKLGFKIDWNTENLVSGSKVVHTYDKDNEVYLGFTIVKQYTYNSRNFTEKTMEVNTYSSEYDLSRDNYKIVYDPTKVEANLRIQKLESDADTIVVVTLGLDDKYKDYRMCAEFYESTGRFILEEYPIVKGYWGEYEIRFRCKEEHASGIRTMAKAFINDKS